MDPDWFRLAAGLPFAAPVVEVAHQLFLFGVDRDDRLTRPEMGGDPTVEIGELGVAVRMRSRAALSVWPAPMEAVSHLT